MRASREGTARPVTVAVTTSTGVRFDARVRIDTPNRVAMRSLEIEAGAAAVQLILALEARIEPARALERLGILARQAARSGDGVTELAIDLDRNGNLVVDQHRRIMRWPLRHRDQSRLPETLPAFLSQMISRIMKF